MTMNSMEKIKYKIQNNYPITLEDLKEHKREILGEIHEQQNLLNDRFERIVAPFTRSENSNPLMNTFNMGMAAFDALASGFRIMRKISNFFMRKR